MPKCPLCRSHALEQIGLLPTSDLVLAYRKVFDVDVANFFHEHSLRFLRCSSCDLRFFDPPVTGDSVFYERLSAFDGYYMDNKPEFEFAKRFISPNDAVLEIGGGKGGFGKSLPAENYTGLEFNKEAVQVARSAGIRMVLDSIEDHAAGNGEKYDVVCTFQVLEHVSNPRSFLEAAINCLKPDGRLIVSVPSYDSFQRNVLNNLLNMPPHHVTIWSNRSLLNMAALVGTRMEHIEQEKVAPYHFAWFVQSALYRLMRRNSEVSKLVDLGGKARFFSRIATVGAMIVMPIAGALMRRLPVEFLPNGHSVMAIFRKI